MKPCWQMALCVSESFAIRGLLVSHMEVTSVTFSDSTYNAAYHTVNGNVQTYILIDYYIEW